MSEDKIDLRIGPCPSTIARAWIDNRRAFVDAARSSPEIALNDDALELLDMFLSLWRAEAQREPTFEWRFRITPDVLLLVARYWLDLGQVSPAERAAMGVPVATAELEPFTEAVVAGMIAALHDAGPAGHALIARLQTP